MVSCVCLLLRRVRRLLGLPVCRGECVPRFRLLAPGARVAAASLATSASATLALLPSRPMCATFSPGELEADAPWASRRPSFACVVSAWAIAAEQELRRVGLLVPRWPVPALARFARRELRLAPGALLPSGRYAFVSLRSGSRPRPSSGGSPYGAGRLVLPLPCLVMWPGFGKGGDNRYCPGARPHLLTAWYPLSGELLTRYQRVRYELRIEKKV